MSHFSDNKLCSPTRGCGIQSLSYAVLVGTVDPYPPRNQESDIAWTLAQKIGFGAFQGVSFPNRGPLYQNTNLFQVIASFSERENSAIAKRAGVDGEKRCCSPTLPFTSLFSLGRREVGRVMG